MSSSSYWELGFRWATTAGVRYVVCRTGALNLEAQAEQLVRIAQLLD